MSTNVICAHPRPNLGSWPVVSVDSTGLRRLFDHRAAPVPPAWHQADPRSYRQTPARAFRDSPVSRQTSIISGADVGRVGSL